MSTHESIAPSASTERVQQHRRYLMCRPEHFTVSYSINPWMEPTRPTDTPRAIQQWQRLYDTYRSLGHDIELIDPLDGLPDMVSTANRRLVISRIRHCAKFAPPPHVPGGPAV